jgi:hypothetical protein
MVSPHYPPDSSAATHRVRILAPFLAAEGWDATVVTVDPRDYETRLDPELASLVDGRAEVVRCRAWNAQWTRAFGIGDLGLRSFWGLRRACDRLLRDRHYDVLFVTVYPVYPALLGPLMKRRFGVKFVLDYQDPWVGAWGQRVGGGREGRPDWKSIASRRLGTILEPIAVAAADGLMGVSEATYEDVLDRVANAHPAACLELPIGFDPRDFTVVDGDRPFAGGFRSDDGLVHLCYVGTLLPTGVETLRALLAAARLLASTDPMLYPRLRLHFYGTSNTTNPDAETRVMAIAREVGVAEIVTETPARLDYFDALTVLRHASAVLVLGSSEPHYTASKLYPAIAVERPILAVFHAASTAVAILARVGGEPTFRVVTHAGDAALSVGEIRCALAALIRYPVYRPNDISREGAAETRAPALARRFARFLDEVCDAG